MTAASTLSPSTSASTPSPPPSSALSPPPSALSPPVPMESEHPIPNSYWATPYLLACEYPWAPGATTPKLDALLRAGVRTFVDLTEPGELRPYAACALHARARALGIESTHIEYLNFPIPDRCTPSSRGYMVSILSALRGAERAGRMAAVHCRGGIGRTGMVVGCWLVARGTAADGDEALEIVAQRWKTVEKCRRYPCSPETGPQCQFVRTWRRSAAFMAAAAAAAAASGRAVTVDSHGSLGMDVMAC